MLVRVEVVEIVGLFAELHTSIASAKLLNKEGVVLLYDFPYQLPRNIRHLQKGSKNTMRTTNRMNKKQQRKIYFED